MFFAKHDKSLSQDRTERNIYKRPRSPTAAGCYVAVLLRIEICVALVAMCAYARPAKLCLRLLFSFT